MQTRPGAAALMRCFIQTVLPCSLASVTMVLFLVLVGEATALDPPDTEPPSLNKEVPGPDYKPQEDEWCPDTPVAQFASNAQAKEFGKLVPKNWIVRINGNEVALVPPPHDKEKQWNSDRDKFENAASNAVGYKRIYNDADGFKVHDTGDQWHDSYNVKHWQAMKACDNLATGCYRGHLPGSQPRVVAVLDHGVADHNDLPAPISRYELQATYSDDANCIIKGCCPAKEPFLTSDHATRVAGLIGALGNGQGIIGLGAVEKFISIRVRLAEGGCIRRDHVERGIKCAQKLGADVINMSFGSADDPNEPVKIRQALEAAQNQTLAVTSAGNNGHVLGSPGYRIWPANFQLGNLITAEARTLEGNFDGSNYNVERLHLAAPAARTQAPYTTSNYCTNCTDPYQPFDQSSAAAALISAAATLVWSHPNYKLCTPTQLRNVLIQHGRIVQKEIPQKTVCMVQLDFLKNTVEVADASGLPVNKCLDLTTPVTCGE